MRIHSTREAADLVAPTRSSPVHFRKSPSRGVAFVVTTSNRLRRFNWLIVPGQAIAAPGKHQPRRLLPIVMPDIEITEECRASIAAEFPFEQIGRRLPNGNWLMPVAETRTRLQKVQLRSEPIFVLHHLRHHHHLALASCRNSNCFCSIPKSDTVLGGKAWSRGVNSNGISDNLMRSVRSYSNGCRGLGSLPSFFVFGQRNWNFE